MKELTELELILRLRTFILSCSLGVSGPEAGGGGGVEYCGQGEIGSCEGGTGSGGDKEGVMGEEGWLEKWEVDSEFSETRNSSAAEGGGGRTFGGKFGCW